MRISIWQQWASNHSSSYSIVGCFESPEHARKAAVTVDGVVKDFIEWYERPENADLDMLPWDAPPTAVEAELIRKYGLKTDRRLTFTEDVRGSIRVAAVDRLAVIDVGSVLDGPPMLLISLLERLGSQNVTTTLVAEGASVVDTLVSLTCNAPDASVAEAVYHSAQAHLWSISETPPWGNEDTRARGNVLRNGTSLIFDVYFGDIRYGLPALLGHLEALGCKQIAYTLREIGYFRRDEASEMILDEIVQRHGDRLSDYRVKVEEKVNVSCLAPDADMAKRILNLVHKPGEMTIGFPIGFSEWASSGTATLKGQKLTFLDLELQGSGLDVRFHLETIVAFLTSFGCKDLVFDITDMLSGEHL